MLFIPLSGKHGGVTVVDDLDSWVRDLRWRFGGGGYAVGYYDGRFIKLHRFILGLTHGDGLEVDHIDHNRLNNRRDNLRVCTHSQNSCNVSISERNKTGIIGVRKEGRRWHAFVNHKRKHIYLGSFADIGDAIAARLAGARKYFGQFAPNHLLGDGPTCG